LGKLGSATAFAAEAAIWIAGAALIASAAGARWDMPKVDVEGLLGRSSASPASSGSAAPTATVVPAPPPTPATALARFLSYAGQPDMQYAMTASGQWSYENSRTSWSVKWKGSMIASYNDCSESWTSTQGSKTSTQDAIIAGEFVYERTGKAPWTKDARSNNQTCEQVGLVRYSGLVDKGIETKAGKSVHRLEVADPIQFGSYYEKFSTRTTGQTLTQVTMSIWVKEDGLPVAIRLSGSHNQAINGTATHVTYVDDYTVTKTTGATIAPPAL
jgi:hypothetical protein